MKEYLKHYLMKFVSTLYGKFLYVQNPSCYKNSNFSVTYVWFILRHWVTGLIDATVYKTHILK